MLKFILFSGITSLLICCNQQEKKPSGQNHIIKTDTTISSSLPVSNYTIPDLSPMDMIYCPSDYPIKKMTGSITDAPLARIIYSRPQTQGRKIFGELVKYKQPWRLGANEATELELFSEASIQNKTIEPGRYIMYCIPDENKWTIILNENLFSWGLKQDQQKDFLRFEVPVEKTNISIQYFTMAFECSDQQTNLLIFWDDIKTKIEIKFNP